MVRTTVKPALTTTQRPVPGVLAAPIVNCVQTHCLKARQYIVRVASRPEVIIFSMGLDAVRRRNRTRVVSEPIEKIITSSWDAT